MNLFLIVLLISSSVFHAINCDAEQSSLYVDVESTTDTIKLSSLSQLFPNLSTYFKEFEKESVESTDSTSVPATAATVSNEKPIEESINSTGRLLESSTGRLLGSLNSPNRTEQPSSDFIEKPSLNATEQPSSSHIATDSTNNLINSTLKDAQNSSTIAVLITPTPMNNTAIELKKLNATLLSTILLRMHSIIQYSSNFSSQTVIPYVYLTKIQIDGLYRQLVDSTFLQNYISTVFQLLVSDLMNKECNVLSKFPVDYRLISTY